MVTELWRPAGGAYNVDNVLSVMVSGLEEELAARINGNKIYASNRLTPSAPLDEDDTTYPMTASSSPSALSAVRTDRNHRLNKRHGFGGLKQVIGQWLFRKGR